MIVSTIPVTDLSRPPSTQYTDITVRSRHLPPVNHGGPAAPGFRLAAANDESGGGGSKHRERDRRRQTMRATAAVAAAVAMMRAAEAAK